MLFLFLFFYVIFSANIPRVECPLQARHKTHQQQLVPLLSPFPPLRFSLLTHSLFLYNDLPLSSLTSTPNAPPPTLVPLFSPLLITFLTPLTPTHPPLSPLSLLLTPSLIPLTPTEPIPILSHWPPALILAPI